MTTPAYTPVSSLFNTVRYYTEFDPYYYTVDNRPLQDMSNNSTSLAKGVDAARLATLANTFNENLLLESENSNGYNYVYGLTPSTPSNLTIRIGIGAILVPTAVNGSISQVVLKKGILQNYKDLSYNTTGLVGGQSRVFTVEARYLDISATTPTSYFVDTGNSSLFDTSLNGILELQIIQGAVATTGSEVANPVTTSGWIPLYNLHIAFGESVYNKIITHANAPRALKGKRLDKELQLRIPGTNPCTISTALDTIVSYQFSEGADQSAVASFLVDTENISPVRDIVLDLYYTGTISGNNFALMVSYASVTAEATLSGIPFTANALEAVPGPSTAYYLKKVTLAGKIPGSVLNNNKLIVIKIFRWGLSQAGTDTNTGTLLVTGLVARQV